MKRSLLLIAVLCLSYFCGIAQIITTYAGNGTYGYTGDGGPATAAEIGVPHCIATDNYGNVYFIDFYAPAGRGLIRKVDSSGTISTIAGNGVAGFSGDGGLATLAQIDGPGGIAIDLLGNIYFADTRNARIRKIDPAGIISTVAGDGTYGYSGDDGPATLASLRWPHGVAVDDHGNIYFTDEYNYSVRKISTSGIITTIAGNGTSGGSGDGGPATAASIRAGDIGLDAKGNIYINSDSVVRRIDTTGIITKIAGAWPAGSTGDGGPALLAHLGAVGMAVDGTGNVFICELSYARIRKVDTSGIINTVAGGGVCGPYEVADGGPATDACFARPLMWQ